jgi:hypothetical protein
VLTLGTFLLAYACGSSAATSKKSTPSNWVGVAQTVLVSTTATGKVSGKPQVFTQFSANGSGPATLKVPMSSSGFRNLSGFGTAPVKDGYAVWNLHLNGVTHQRSTAHFPSSKLPLQVSAAYELNGKKVKAKDVVGKSGELKVTYVVNNVTTRPTKVTFKNVFGSKETTTVKAPVPIAAVVDVTIPANFTNVKVGSASASGNGNGTTGASWTMFLFKPLGGVKQSITYQAHITNGAVPSATVEAAPLPPTNIKPLPQISEPGAPAVPTVSLGGNLAAIQIKLQAARARLAANAAAVLSAFKQIAVPAAKGVSGQATTVADQLPALSAAATTESTNAANTATDLAQASADAAGAASQATDVNGGLSQDTQDAAAASSGVAGVRGGVGQAAAEAGDLATQIAAARTALQALPAAVHATAAYATLQAKVAALESRLSAHRATLNSTASKVSQLQSRVAAHASHLKGTAGRQAALGSRLIPLSGLLARASSTESNVVVPAAQTASTGLLGLVPKANTLSTDASKTATSLASATVTPRKKKQRKQIGTRTIGGGAKLDSAVGKLDGAITKAGDKVDKAYAYLTALDQRAAANRLPGGNALGATGGQLGAFVYSVSGANNTAHKTHLAIFIGGFALVIGLTFGIGLYRMRRGMPSSLAPPKSSGAAA